MVTGTTAAMCERCGTELQTDQYQVVNATGTPVQQWTVTTPCDCPGPRCPFCTHRLPTTTRCDNALCWAYDLPCFYPDHA